MNIDELSRESEEQIEKQILVITKHTDFLETEIKECYSSGLSSIPKVLYVISDSIDQIGLRSASKRYNQYVFNAYFELIESQFHTITSVYYATRTIDRLPVEHLNLYQKGKFELEQLEKKLLYPDEELDCEKLNQKQIVQLFAALSNANVFTSSPNLLAESIANVTAYSEKSVKRVINSSKSTKGGFEIEEKEYIKKILNKIIDEF
jgi:hypothetical protein